MAVGQHGSWNRSTLSGYRVILVPFSDGRPSGPPQRHPDRLPVAGREVLLRPPGRRRARPRRRAPRGGRRRRRDLAGDRGPARLSDHGAPADDRPPAGAARQRRACGGDAPAPRCGVARVSASQEKKVKICAEALMKRLLHQAPPPVWGCESGVMVAGVRPLAMGRESGYLPAILNPQAGARLAGETSPSVHRLGRQALLPAAAKPEKEDREPWLCLNSPCASSSKPASTSATRPTAGTRAWGRTSTATATASTSST